MKKVWLVETVSRFWADIESLIDIDSRQVDHMLQWKPAAVLTGNFVSVIAFHKMLPMKHRELRFAAPGCTALRPDCKQQNTQQSGVKTGSWDISLKNKLGVLH